MAPQQHEGTRAKPAKGNAHGGCTRSALCTSSLQNKCAVLTALRIAVPRPGFARLSFSCVACLCVARSLTEENGRVHRNDSDFIDLL